MALSEGIRGCRVLLELVCGMQWCRDGSFELGVVVSEILKHGKIRCRACFMLLRARVRFVSKLLRVLLLSIYVHASDLKDCAILPVIYAQVRGSVRRYFFTFRHHASAILS